MGTSSPTSRARATPPLPPMLPIAPWHIPNLTAKNAEFRDNRRNTGTRRFRAVAATPTFLALCDARRAAPRWRRNGVRVACAEARSHRSDDGRDREAGAARDRGHRRGSGGGFRGGGDPFEGGRAS